MTSSLGSGVKAVELDGKTFEGDAIDPMIADLTDEERQRAVVVFESGLRQPLPKFEAHSGDDAVRIRPGGKVFF